MVGTLDGRVALVTGAARGLGRAYALKLADLGAKVVVSDIDLRSFEQFEAEAAQAGGRTTADQIADAGGSAIGVEADVTDRGSVDALVQAAVAEYGQLDIAVCNAGGGAGSIGGSHASQLDPDETDLVIRRNLVGTMNTCIAAAVPMTEQGSGKLITVSSSAGVRPIAGGSYAHYGVAKAGIAMYTRYLAQELGPSGITANCIAPGQITTGRLMVSFEAAGVDKLAAQIPLRRLGTVDDCANVVGFLASRDADYITGVVIPIDGGLTRSPS